MLCNWFLVAGGKYPIGSILTDADKVMIVYETIDPADTSNFVMLHKGNNFYSSNLLMAPIFP